MKNKKGFTLIELLSIIVILAIIAVITVPMILNVIENSRKGAAIDSTYGYIDSINKYYISNLSVDSSYNMVDEVYTINGTTGYLIGSDTLQIKVSGTIPNSGAVELQKNKVKQACIKFGEYAVSYKDGKILDTKKASCSGTNIESEQEIIPASVTLSLENGSKYVNYVDGNGNTILCRVLYNDDTHGLQLISQNSTEEVYLGEQDENYKTEEITLFEKAEKSYNNAIENLNNIAENYINSSIASDARCIGSKSTVLNGTFSSKDDESNTFTGTYEYLSSYESYKDSDTNFISDITQMGMNGLIMSNNYYWFASRNIVSASDNTSFSIRKGNGGLEDSPLINIRPNSSSSNSIHNGFRPVLLIKSNVKVKDGSGTLEEPYNLEAY